MVQVGCLPHPAWTVALSEIVSEEKRSSGTTSKLCPGLAMRGPFLAWLHWPCASMTAHLTSGGTCTLGGGVGGTPGGGGGGGGGGTQFGALCFFGDRVFACRIVPPPAPLPP